MAITIPDAPVTPTARLKPARSTTRVVSRRLRHGRRAKSAGDGAAGATTALNEWYHLDPSDADQRWRDLVGWVAWLHDRYELGADDRLPACWVHHPGLIEELWALRVWRAEIYRRGDRGGGQAARYWHSELRNVITSAHSQYAAGCRSKHHPAEAATGDAVAAWHDTGAPLITAPQAWMDTLTEGHSS